jgi:NADH-quinone oxidoreductase subunit C
MVFLSILNLFNFVFKYSIFYINFLNKLHNFSLNLLILNSWIYNYIIFLKYSSFFFKTMLIDINSFDYNKNFVLNNKKKISINCIIYYFFLSKFNIKINLFSFTSEINKVQSISNLFNNALWTERELAEMFNINFLNKLDNRNLLLDYSYIGYPLLKLFPVTGNVELYYNFLKNWISYTALILKESSKTEFFYY